MTVLLDRATMLRSVSLADRLAGIPSMFEASFGMLEIPRWLSGRRGGR